MDEIYQDIPRIYTALAEWLSCMVFLLLLKKRHTGWKLGLISAGALAVQTSFLVLTGDLMIAFWLPCMAAAAGLMFLFFVLCAEVSCLEAGYCCACAFLLAEFAASLEWQIHTFLAAAGFDSRWFQGILLLVIYAVVYAGAFFFMRKLFSWEYVKQLSGRELVSAVGIVSLVFVFSNMSFVVTNTPFTSAIRADIFNIRTLVDLGGMAVLYAMQSRICEYMAEREVASIRAALKSQYEQYRNYQDSMDLIHMKYHDLKHQIMGLRGASDGAKRNEWLDAMEEELKSAELVDQTGNQVLDAILGAKILQARKNDIRITCVADGTLLDFMHVTDICTIFGNALDNALESVIMLENPQQRLIHVTVSAQKSFVFIQVSNYCGQELKQRNGQMPETTKADKKNHGFGLKSIKYSVEKYGGSMAIDLKKKWFELRILIPMEAE